MKHQFKFFDAVKKTTFPDRFITIKRVLLDLFWSFPTYSLLFFATQFIKFMTIEFVGRRIYRYAILNADFLWVTKQNISMILRNYLTVFMIVALILLATVAYLMLKYVIYRIIHTQAKAPGRFSLQKLFHKMTLPDFALLMLYINMIVLPAYITIQSIVSRDFQLPQVFKAIVQQFPLLTGLFVLFHVAVLYIFARLLFTLYIYFLDSTLGVRDAMMSSWKMTSFTILRQKPVIFLSLVFFFSSTMIDYWLKSVYSLQMVDFSIILPEGINILPWVIGAIILFTIRITLFVIPLLFIIFAYTSYTGKPLLAQRNKLTFSYFSQRFLFLLVLIFTVVQTSHFFEKKTSETLVISHRGDISRAIENTIPALYDANRKRADMVEFDIQMTKDKHVVVFHDYSIKNLTGIDRNIKEMELSEIRAVKLRRSDISASIPTFDAYVQAASNLQQPILVDIKTVDADLPASVAKILGTVQKYNFLSLTMFQSTNLKILEEIKRQSPESVVGLIYTQSTEAVSDVLDFYSVDQKIADLQTYQALRNKRLFVWTLNDIDAMQPIFDVNLDGIITDSLSKALLKKSYSHMWDIDQLIWNIFMY